MNYAQHFTILQYHPYETYFYNYFILNGISIGYEVERAYYYYYLKT